MEYETKKYQNVKKKKNKTIKNMFKFKIHCAMRQM